MLWTNSTVCTLGVVLPLEKNLHRPQLAYPRNISSSNQGKDSGNRAILSCLGRQECIWTYIGTLFHIPFGTWNKNIPWHVLCIPTPSIPWALKQHQWVLHLESWGQLCVLFILDYCPKLPTIQSFMPSYCFILILLCVIFILIVTIIFQSSSGLPPPNNLSCIPQYSQSLHRLFPLHYSSAEGYFVHRSTAASIV